MRGRHADSWSTKKTSGSGGPPNNWADSDDGVKRDVMAKSK